MMWRFSGVLTSSITVSPAAGNATTYLTGLYSVENLSTGSFSITLSLSAGALVLPQGFRGLIFVDTVNGPRMIAIAGKTNPATIPIGAVSPFFQASAPAGWTQVTTPALNDTAIRLVTGTGGGTGGSVLFSTLFARTGTDPVTLTAANLPTAATYDKITNTNSTTSGSQANAGVTTTPTPLTGAANTAFTPAIDMRIQYSNWLVCSYSG